MKQLAVFFGCAAARNSATCGHVVDQCEHLNGFVATELQSHLTVL